MEDRVGELLNGKYRLEALLGTGAMGSVYRAVNTSIGRPVAIKILHANVLGAQEIVDRFVREGRIAATVHHPNVVEVLDFDRDELGLPFIVQELLQGRDLDDHLAHEGGRLPPAAVIDIGIQAAEGLGAAHEHGLVHRDVKPANIFLAEHHGVTRAKVVDFGISKVQAPPDKRRTAAGTIMGTPLYMSPEQISKPLAVDARSDVWSMGVVLYELLAGVSPFDGQSTSHIFHHICNMPAEPIGKRVPSVPRALADVIEVCLAKPADARFDDGRQLAEALRQAKKALDHNEAARTLGPSERAEHAATLEDRSAAATDGMPWGELASLSQPPAPKRKPAPVLSRPAPEPRADATRSSAREPVMGRDSMGDDPLNPFSGGSLELDMEQPAFSRPPSARADTHRAGPRGRRAPAVDSPISLSDALVGAAFVGATAFVAPRSSAAAVEELVGHGPGLSPVEALAALFVLIVILFTTFMLAAAARERAAPEIGLAALGAAAVAATTALTLTCFAFPRLPVPPTLSDSLPLVASVASVVVALGLSVFGVRQVRDTFRSTPVTGVVVIGGALMGILYSALTAAGWWT